MPFPVPVPYQGVVIVDGEAYEKDRYARAYASRATTAFRAFWTLVADGVARVDPTTTSESLDEIDNILSILDESLDTIDIQDLLRASEPPSRLPRQPRADFDARVIQTRSGGVLLWLLDGLLSHVRAYVMLDDEQISGERATLRDGDPIFTTVSQQIAVLQGTTVAVGIEVGAWVENGTVIAVVDGAPVVSSAAGRVLRIEHVGAEHDELSRGVVEARADFSGHAHAFRGTRGAVPDRRRQRQGHLPEGQPGLVRDAALHARADRGSLGVRRGDRAPAARSGSRAPRSARGLSGPGACASIGRGSR